MCEKFAELGENRSTEFPTFVTGITTVIIIIIIIIIVTSVTIVVHTDIFFRSQR